MRVERNTITEAASAKAKTSVATSATMPNSIHPGFPPQPPWCRIRSQFRVVGMICSIHVPFVKLDFVTARD